MAKQPVLSEAEYFSEHGAELGFSHPLEADQKPYEFNMNAAQTRLQSGELMSELIARLNSLAESYVGGRPHLLYYPAKPSDLIVVVKPYSSVLTKIYRVNYLRNKKYPNPPTTAGYVTRENLYGHAKMNDLLRARLVCKYMDGPQLVAEELGRFCAEKGLEFRHYPMNNEQGYYAWHCYIKLPVEMMFGGTVEERTVWFELQVTTQLAELIMGLTHGLYEGARVRTSGVGGDEWRWQPKSQQFRSAYLGHSLHLLEGIIQTFRDEVLGLDDDGSSAQAPAAFVETSMEPQIAAGTEAADVGEKDGD